jgi:hypothetical protein
MAKYVVPLTTWADVVVTVETDETDPEKIAVLAMEQGPERGDEVNIGDVWAVVRNEDGSPEFTKD